MSELPLNPITSPTLKTDPGIVHSAKEFSGALTLDLTDAEIKQAFETITKISKKYRSRFIYKFNDMSLYKSVEYAAEAASKLIDAFENELKDAMAQQQLVVRIDMDNVYNGGSPIVELVGAMESHISAKEGLDHTRKEWEVKKSVERGESFYGEKYEPNPESKRQKNLQIERKRRKDHKNQ